MSSKKQRIVLGMIFVVFYLPIFTVDGSAGDTKIDRATLKGLKGVEVVIQDIRSEAQGDGLTKDLLQKDVELRLRKAGIKVLTMAESLKTPGMPYLYVNINTLKEKELYAINISVELKQGVYLDRNPAINIHAETWSAKSVVMVGANQMKTHIRESLGNKVDKFINAYFVVNPK